MEKDSNKVTLQRRWIKRKNSGKPERYFHNKYSVQNMKSQSNMSNMQTAGTKNRSTMDNIILINAIIKKQRQGHKNTHLLFADAEKCFDKLWVKDWLIEMGEIATQNKQKSRNNHRYSSGPN